MRKKRCFLFSLLIFGILIAVNSPGNVYAKDVRTVEKKNEVVKICLYVGQHIFLADMPDGEVSFSREKVVDFSGKKVSALAPGKTMLSVNTGKNIQNYAEIEVRENEILAGLTFSDQSFPGRILGAGSFSLPVPEFEKMECVWSSDDVTVATVTPEGVITPAAPGRVNMKVQVTDQYGGTYSFTIPLCILEPKFSIQKTNLAKGCQMTLALEAVSGNPAAYQTGDASIVSIVSQSAYGVTVKAKKVGTAVITAVVDGVSLSCKIAVTNPKLKTVYGFYQKNKKISLKVTGLNAASRPVYASGDLTVAKVNQSGRVTSLKYGGTIISCTVDGKVLKYYLAVSTKKAVKAMRYGYRQVGKKKYSQARRMSKNYFDCSSFVYRCYRTTGKYLVCKTKWAPVAADIARYYVRKGKRIKASGSYSPKKLRPGDLVCFGGSKAPRNGRYKRIYHIAIYIGNGKTMESSSTYNNVVIRDRGTLKKSGIPVVIRP